MLNWNSYINIPWKFNGRDRDGCDCIGLCDLFYKEQNWQPRFDDGKEIEKGWYNTNPYRLVRFLEKNFDKVDSIDGLTPGSIVYARINGEGHVFIYVGYGKILQSFPPITEYISTVSHIDRWKYLEPHIENVRYFKRREEVK